MSVVELAGLYENLSLAEEDGAMLEASEEVQQEGAVDVDRSLMGRVLSGKRERNRFWQRSPWHFGKSLIVLEKLVGSGDVSKLGFNRAEECWGKFIRVKVQIDISKLLKRWLRLKWGKEDNIVVVGLKYGQWIRAAIMNKYQSRVPGQASESSSERGRSIDKDLELSGGGSHNLQSGSLVSMAIDGPINGPVLSEPGLSPIDGDLRNGPGSLPTVPRFDEPNSKEVESNFMLIEKLSPNSDNQKMKKPIPQSTPTKKSGRKWKRAALGGEQLQLVGKVTSPLQRMLMASRVGKKTPKSHNSPKVPSADFSQFCMISWAIWDDRNSLVNNGKAKDPLMLVSWVMNFHEEFQNSRSAFSPQPPKPLVREAADWLAPPLGQLKLNISIATQSLRHPRIEATKALKPGERRELSGSHC
ncbi:hypothetical protein EZV62_015049 [Acer yangbiense]|uniref:DUF4283 domain-containing protein n=1 Tax=Acer yangbiense TaxID=1000413 RepID=A0A5C7HVY7_9ROSI|nr:hypothetical protein EZV62_015049 [Acer yangbiense]